MPLYSGRVCGRPTSARIYIVVACFVAVVKNIHVTVTRGAQYKSVSVCFNGSLQYQTVLDDVCGYPNDEYMVSIQSACTEAPYTLRLLISIHVHFGIK